MLALYTSCYTGLCIRVWVHVYVKDILHGISSIPQAALGGGGETIAKQNMHVTKSYDADDPDI